MVGFDYDKLPVNNSITDPEKKTLKGMLLKAGFSNLALLKKTDLLLIARKYDEEHAPLALHQLSSSYVVSEEVKNRQRTEWDWLRKQRQQEQLDKKAKNDIV